MLVITLLAVFNLRWTNSVNQILILTKYYVMITMLDKWNPGIVAAIFKRVWEGVAGETLFCAASEHAAIQRVPRAEVGWGGIRLMNKQPRDHITPSLLCHVQVLAVCCPSSSSW